MQHPIQASLPVPEPPPVDFSSIRSVDEGCAKLSAFLGLDEPVSRDVFLSAVEDPTYATNLYLSKVEPAFLKHVLRHPPRKWNGGAAGAGEGARRRGSGELLTRAAKSFLKWTASGFAKADDDTYQRRLDACAACPHHLSRPAKLIYAAAGVLTGKSEEGQRLICDLCGCLTTAKARLSHESCPDPHPTKPGLTRWSEPDRRRSTSKR